MRFFFGLLVLSIFQGAFAQADVEAIIKSEREAYTAKHSFKSKRSGNKYDLTYQKLNLTIDPATRLISGSVYSELTALEDNFSSVSFDLDDRMTVDSVIYKGSTITFNHSADEVKIAVPSHKNGDKLAVEVFYKGDPSVNEQKGFSYDFQPDGPIAWTLSEPYGAYGWWPCKQQLTDKIDSFDMAITIPKGNKAAGLGLLVSVDTLQDESLVFNWQHRYPVATYLVAVAVTNYYEQSHYVKLQSGDSVYHLDYLYPAYKPAADTLRKNVNPMLILFDSLFGDYPFKKEKYGHAQFGRGGGMEHQTMSFMSDLNFNLMAHELAHQWFGNKITCGSWQDLWLNEGFATYCNAIAKEFLQPKEEWEQFIANCITRGTIEDGGSVYATDTNQVNVLFSGNIRYRKGAIILHMLRWELGDEHFFEAIKQYVTDGDLCYDFARTPDLKYYLEKVSGKDLTEFFDLWVYKEGYPTVLTRWNRLGDEKISLQISQTTSHPSVSFFPLKMEYKLIGENRDTSIILDNTLIADYQEINVGFKVTSVTFDPNLWLLARNVVIEGNHFNGGAITVYPNPSTDKVSVLIKDKKVDEISVFDLNGRKVLTKDVLDLKNQNIDLDVKGLTNGLYFINAVSGDENIQLKFIKATE